MLTFDCALCTRSGQPAPEVLRCKCSCPACHRAPLAVCPTCRGMWNRVFGVLKCETCSGSGRVPPACDACQMNRHDQACTRCHGTGSQACRGCGGTARVDLHQALMALRSVENNFFTGMRSRERSWNQGPLTELDPTEARRAIAGWVAERRPMVYLNPDSACLADAHLMLTVHKVSSEGFVLHYSTGAEDTDYGKEFRGPAEAPFPASGRPGRTAPPERPRPAQAHRIAAHH